MQKSGQVDVPVGDFELAAYFFPVAVDGGTSGRGVQAGLDFISPKYSKLINTETDSYVDFPD